MNKSREIEVVELSTTQNIEHTKPEKGAAMGALVDMDRLKNDFARSIAEVAPDLKSDDLAGKYAAGLFAALCKRREISDIDGVVAYGQELFYEFGKSVVGPIAVKFVDTVLKECSGVVIFPARDATPFYEIAKALKASNPSAYNVSLDDMHNPVFNRKLWGINDELDSEGATTQLESPLGRELLEQMGFYSPKEVAFVDVGCWGTLVHQLKTAMSNGKIPLKEFKVYFFYTHMPEYIYGYANMHADGIPDGILETISDTWEAFPKSYKRPSKLERKGGKVVPSMDGTHVESPFLKPWSEAATRGIVDAAVDLQTNAIGIDPAAELLDLSQFIKLAQSGAFTGMLPGHTETWSAGDSWRKDWKWGKVPPRA